jgi:phospholipid/cholesterol/gamma-HCH transport system substrate-binding protein
VDLPANATAKIGQTSLLGTLHIELAPPVSVAPQGKLRNGSLIPLSSAGAYPTTEQTLAVLSMLLNGGGIGQIQDIVKAFSTAFAGREMDLRSFIEQLDQFTGQLDEQKHDILAASDSLNNLVGQFAQQKPVLDKALRTLPDALSTLNNERTNIADATEWLGNILGLTGDVSNKSKAALVAELKDLGPVLESLGNAGPDLTRSLSMLATFPWPKETLDKWFRGDYANLTAVFDLTLSRLDTGLLTGSRYAGNLTQVEMYWGRTIGQLPSPATAGNPLIIPYRADQGP